MDTSAVMFAFLAALAQYLPCTKAVIWVQNTGPDAVQPGSFPISAKIKLIKELRHILGCGLREAKFISEGTPWIIEVSQLQELRAYADNHGVLLTRYYGEADEQNETDWHAIALGLVPRDTALVKVADNNPSVLDFLQALEIDKDTAKPFLLDSAKLETFCTGLRMAGIDYEVLYNNSIPF